MEHSRLDRIKADLAAVTAGSLNPPYVMPCSWSYIKELVAEVDSENSNHSIVWRALGESDRLKREVEAQHRKQDQVNLEYADLAKKHLKLQKKCEGLLKQCQKLKQEIVEHENILVDEMACDYCLEKFGVKRRFTRDIIVCAPCFEIHKEEICE